MTLAQLSAPAAARPAAASRRTLHVALSAKQGAPGARPLARRDPLRRPNAYGHNIGRQIESDGHLMDIPAAESHAAGVQTASLTRTIVGVAGSAGRPLLGGMSGPVKVLVGMMMTLVALIALVRTWIVNRGKNCSDCRGYGIARCRLCEGRGAISWEGKFQHNYDCPLCFGQRHTRCESCGGGYRRSLFAHLAKSPPQAEPFAPALEALKRVPITRTKIVEEVRVPQD